MSSHRLKWPKLMATEKPTFLRQPHGPAVAKAFGQSIPPRQPSKARSNHASSIGDICERRLVYARTRGNEANPFSPGLLGIFETGNTITPIVLENLNAFGRRQTPGWEILERERLIDDAQFAKWNIGCQLDGVRHVADTAGRLRPYNVVECKTINSNMFTRVEERDDLRATHWLAKSPDQLLIGMLGRNLTDNPGWIILINKENIFDLRIIEIPFDLDRCETLLKRAERINAHVATGTLPKQITRPDLCLQCPYVHICSPKLEADPYDDPRIITKAQEGDFYEELNGLLENHLLLDEERREAATTKNKLKKILVPGQRLVCGDYEVAWKVHGRGWRMIVRRLGNMD